MSDLLSELKVACAASDITSKSSGQRFVNHIASIIEKYCWHPVSEPPNGPCEVWITKRDGTVEEGMYYGSCFNNPFHVDAIAWAYLNKPEPYKPEAAK